MNYKKCYICGADEGLHHHETMQCPKNGIEETRFDKLTGKFYPQQWEETTFVDADSKKQELAIPQMINALKAAKTYLEYQIEFGGGHGDEAKVLQQIESALINTGEIMPILLFGSKGEAPTEKITNEHLKFAEWCIMNGVTTYYNEDDGERYIDNDKEMFFDISQIYEKFKLLTNEPFFCCVVENGQAMCKKQCQFCKDWIDEANELQKKGV